MKLINELHLSGRVATDPEKRGNGPFRFRLAHGGGGKRKDGTPWPTMWFTITYWDAGIAPGLANGNQVEVWGKLRDATFTGKDGQQKSFVEITAEAIRPNGEDAQPPKPLTPNIHGVEVSDADIPF